jgi:hypothetical protein
VAVAAAPARAQVTTEPAAAIFPDPSKFAHGLYTEGEIGGVAFFGPVGENVSPGFAVGARLGYDLTRWAAVQVHALGTTHETKGDGPWAGQLLQSYQGTAEGKLTLRFVQTALFVEGGIGVARWSTNLLNALGLARYRTGLNAGGGGGIDYHSLSRHFSVGLRAGYFWLRDASDSRDLIVTTYLRYTF